MQKSHQFQEMNPEDLEFMETSQNDDDKFKNIPPQYGPQGYSHSIDNYQPMPKKIIIICLLLLIIGAGFLIAGFINYFSEIGQKERAIMFFIIGTVLFIPAIYYSYFLFEAYRATSPEERQQILNEIPMEQEY